MKDDNSPGSWPTKIDSSGRIMIPADARSGRGWDKGTELVLEEDVDGTIRVVTLEQFLERIQDYFSEKFGPERSLVAELRAERKQEALRESRN